MIAFHKQRVKAPFLSLPEGNSTLESASYHIIFIYFKQKGFMHSEEGHWFGVQCHQVGMHTLVFPRKWIRFFHLVSGSDNPASQGWCGVERRLLIAFAWLLVDDKHLEWQGVTVVEISSHFESNSRGRCTGWASVCFWGHPRVPAEGKGLRPWLVALQDGAVTPFRGSEPQQCTSTRQVRRLLRNPPTCFLEQTPYLGCEDALQISFEFNPNT